MVKRAKKVGFILLESVIYFLFISFDISGKDSTAIKYFGIVLCFLYSLTNIGEGKNSLFLCLALLFTLVADWFLLVKNNNYVFGVCSFIVAQIIYCVRLIDDNVKIKRIIAIRIPLIIVLLIALYFFKLLDTLTFLVVIYFVDLLCNTIDGYSLFGKSVENKLFAIGMTLFVLCDISVGLNNLSSYVDISSIRGLVKIANFAMWVFYLPSQTLIALSSKGAKNGK